MTSAPPAPHSKRKRADARRNRDRIFAAAKECFAAAGPAVRMEDIARAADTGIGTLYRSFGNRAGLAEAIFRDALERLVEAANQSGMADSDPEASLQSWIAIYVSEMQAKRTMLADLTPLFEADPSILPDARASAAAALGKLLDCAQAAGKVRPDIDGESLMLLVNGIAVGPASGTDATRRLLQVVFDGLSSTRGRAGS
ncbi:TetR/AcrR family transcriptional regulator [Tsuneonella mangrovi]|uniref:TetR/AcrR family transcriptional regulator n=1 Tax=Tsuneonella mangrovi TaxID=1982042 RepID=UPI000BA1D98B|nr:TetR/AcrR family transcriptional regulator [Tsuneonella mangrovi]